MRYEVLLKDGTRVVLRPIRPDDKEMLADAFTRLSDRSRYERFFTHLKRLTQEQLRYLTEVDQLTHAAWVAVAVDDGEAQGIGVVRWIRLHDDPEVAEVAVTVVDEFQGKGVGRTLIYVAAQDARSKGVKAFRAWVRGENRATLHMLETMAAAAGRWEDGVLEITVPLEGAESRDDLVPLELRVSTR
jgi:GNAT superfamily N-acetyltransferase